MALLLCLVGTVVFSQTGRIISTKDGLPQSFISGLEQDKAGFVWVGTRNGLARFDGLDFKVLQHKNSDTSSLSSNLIITIKSFNNAIWIEHESGDIDQLDPVTEQINHYGNPANFKSIELFRRAWVADSKGILWRIVDGQGLLRCGNKPVFYSRKSNGFDSDTLWGVLEGEKDLLWVLTKNGLSSLNRKSGKVVNYGSPKRPDFHDYNFAVRLPIGLHRRSNGELMWTDRKYIYFFSPITNKFLRVVPFSAANERGVTFIRTGPDGSDYFERNGILYRYNELLGLQQIYNQSVTNKGSLMSFLVDKSGLVWLGTNAHGIYQLDLTTPFFPSFPVKEGFAGDVLRKEFGQKLSGLFGWDIDDKRFASPGYHIRSVYDKRGSLWLGLKEKVVRYDPTTRKFTSFPPVRQLVNSGENGIGLKGLTLTPQGVPVVVGYNRNVLIYNETKKQWDWLIPEGELQRQLGKEVTPQDIWMDAERIWITTEMEGLLFYEIKTGKIHQLRQNSQQGSLPTNQLLAIEPDPSRSHLLWIGSYNGLICLNKKTLKAEVFNTKQGLPDNAVYSLLTDHYGNLWFGTNKGLCSFSPITHKVRTFKTRHGLLEDEFNRFHQLKLPDGRLAMGGTEGWTLFDPDKIKDDEYQPDIALTSLKINNEEVVQSADGILTKPFNALTGLSLPYNQNTLTLAFAGLQYNQPQDLQYRYQLVGYDTDWIVAGHVTFANYTKIPPGVYEFLVNASNTGGQWSKEIKKLKITINAPWWRTWWAYLIYALVIAGSTWYWFRLQLVRLELRKSVELKQQETEQLRVLAEMKERFFTNITHDFRTPLTLILSPLTALIKNQEGSPNEQKLISIKRNAEQLLKLINQLLDFSKLDYNVLSVSESAGNIASFTENVTNLFKEEALKKGVNLHLKSSVVGEYWFDAAKLERMLGNLIGNALKFTPSGGTVTVGVVVDHNDLVFSVTDTGFGIPQKQIAYVFDRYYQVKSEKQVGGTGIGLALVKELAELQKGIVEVESKEGKGSTFRIRMPYQPVVAAEIVDSTESKTTNDWGTPVVADGDVRILLVEDNAELSDFIASSLPESYKIDKASNGAEGLKIALETLPDLIISDVAMPIMDGFELCRQVKEHEPTNHIPVIMLTARVAIESRMEGLLKGADDYLAKPFHVPELNLRVYNLLERQRRLREYIKNKLEVPQLEEQPKTEEVQDPFLVKFYAIVDENLDNSSIGVENISAMMNMSRSQLHRKLRAIAGMSISDLVRNHRLVRGAEFLKSGLGSSEAAYKSGFDSPAYFSKCFREFYGVTPTDFQKRTI